MLTIKNILSIDVEEVFQTEYAKQSGFPETNYRSPSNIPPILELLKETDNKATFFVVGQVAKRYPKILNNITEGDCEVGFHTYEHTPLWQMTKSQLERELIEFNALVTSVIGQKCRGFRAPSFSLYPETSWAINLLNALDFCYDSSIFPAWTPLYGVTNAPRCPYKLSCDDLTKDSKTSKLWEFPLATYSFLGMRIPAAGSFYLRTIPNIVRRAIKDLNRKGFPAVVYVHNWDLDPETPQLKLGLYKSFVTYHNHGKTENFLKKLLCEFQFTSFAEYIKETQTTPQR